MKRKNVKGEAWVENGGKGMNLVLQIGPKILNPNMTWNYNLLQTHSILFFQTIQQIKERSQMIGHGASWVLNQFTLSLFFFFNIIII